MPVYIVTAPDGREYEIEGEGTQEEALAYFKSQWQPLKPHEDPSNPKYGQAPVDPSLYDQGDIRKQKALQTVRELARQTGRGLTGLADGVMALPRMAVNLPSNIVNAFGGNAPTLPGLQESVPEFAPQSGTERFADKLTGGLGGVMGGMGVGGAMSNTANQSLQGIGRTLTSRPVVQTASTVTGAAGSELGRNAGPVGELIGGLGGAMAPGFFGAAAPMATRGGFRGGEAGRQRVENNLRMFEKAGVSPTVGQATEGRMMRGAESLLSRTPGGAGRMVKTAEAQADDLAAAIEKRAAQLAKKTSGEQTGRAIARGVSRFADDFRAKQKELYDKLDAYFPPQRPVSVENTKATLSKLNEDIQGAQSLSQWFKNAKIRGIYGSLLEDTGVKPVALKGSPMERLRAAKSLDELDVTAHKLRIGLDENPSPEQLDLENAYFSLRQAMKAGGAKSEVMEESGRLPYEAVKKLRTLVGQEMESGNLASQVSRDKWSSVYAALSRDIENATKSNPAAAQAWKRANNYTRSGMRRIEAIESVVDRAGGPESIFRAATANTKEGATTLRSVMQSLDGEGQKTVSATVLRRLGIANPSNQNELGENFSTSTFLTNWNKLSPEAKRTLFDRYGASFREDMDQIAKITSNLREGSKVFQNPSGTEQATAQAATVGGFALSVLTGQVGTAATIAAGVGGANLMARLMTNPRFVRWLAQSTKHPLAHAPSMIASLASQAEGDEDMALAAAILEQQQRQQD